MKKFLLFFLLFTLNFYSQEQKDSIINQYYFGMDVMPEFPGGFSAFHEFINKNYIAPNIKGLKGRVVAEFIIEIDGSLNEIKVVKDIGFGTGEELLRVLKLSPVWKPGIQNGRAVRTRFSIPLNIEIKDK